MSLARDIKKLKQGNVFFSNRLEVLLELLIEKIYKEDPFYTPQIIIPSKEMGRWIRREIADRLSIACNIKTLFLHEALKNPLPSRLELTTRIYPEIADLEYVKGSDKRRMVLAQTLAGFFQRYALYGVTFEEDWQKRVWEKLNLQIDLTPKSAYQVFAFSHIPEKIFYSFADSQFYHLSPCQEFWSDLTRYDHQLLGSCGTVGRKFAAMVEESGIATEPYYLPGVGNSALHAFQNRMLLLEGDKIVADDSISVHLVSTRRREVEVLHHLLIQEEIEPKDVLVMAPDIALYRPYIQAIFENYQITDMPAALNAQVKGLELFLNLEKRRYSVLAFLELFRHPLFYRRWNEGDLEQIKLWIEETGIRWGIDGQFRKEVLLVDAFETGTTWESGFDQLLEDLALGDRVSFTDAELLGELIETVRSLYEQRAQGKKSMAEWVDFLRKLCKDFFVESEEQLWFFQKLEPLRRGDSMPFDAFQLLMEEELQGEGLTINPNQLQVYRFSSMLPMRSIPAKLIWLLGMDLDSFPRMDKKLSFDLSRRSHTYSPSRIDFDRYLFLESVLSAREKLVISMIGRDPLDNQERPPSTVVSDFLTHFELEPIKHAANSYDEPLTKIDYEMALASQKQEKLVAPFALQIAESPLKEAVIDIADLLRLARSPLKHYFRHRLGMRFRQEIILKEEEEFVLSPLTFARLQSDALRFSLTKAMQKTKMRGEYPLGLFQKIADDKCARLEEVETKTIEWLEHIKKPEQVADRLWHYPPIKCGPVTIVGRVDGVHDHSLLIPKKCDLRNVIANWPLLLIFQEVRFLNENKSIKMALEPFLSYFFKAQEYASPLFPTWVKPILENDGELLEMEMAAPTFDESLLWSTSGRIFQNANQLIETWKPVAETLYGEVLDDWF